MVKKLIMIILMLIPLAGCYDNQQMGDIVIVSGVGIDADGDKFLVSAELVKMSPGEEGESGMKAVVISSEGDTVTEALDDITRKTSGNLHFNHCRVVLIGESAARSGIDFAIDLILQDFDFHTSSGIVIARGAPASEILSGKPENQSTMAYEISKMLSVNQTDMQMRMKTPVIDFNNCAHGSDKHAVFPAVSKNGEGVKLNGAAFFTGTRLEYFR